MKTTAKTTTKTKLPTLPEGIPTQLPTEKLGRKMYYRDDRLRQYRNVKNPHDFMSFDDAAKRFIDVSRPKLTVQSVKTTHKKAKKTTDK